MDVIEAPQVDRRGLPRSRRLGVLLGVALAVVVALFAFVSTRGEDERGAMGTAGGARTLTNDGGNVTVTVTWAGASAGPRFTVTLDTHSVDLDGIDLGKLAVLRVDGMEVAPLSWDAPPGGHHRKGTLTFPETGDDGSPLIRAGSTVELVIRDVADVPERVFRWSP